LAWAWEQQPASAALKAAEWVALQPPEEQPGPAQPELPGAAESQLLRAVEASLPAVALPEAAV
jgi:hypothetical protein